jgi:hypothetical protein
MFWLMCLGMVYRALSINFCYKEATGELEQYQNKKTSDIIPILGLW